MLLPYPHIQLEIRPSPPCIRIIDPSGTTPNKIRPSDDFFRQIERIMQIEGYSLSRTLASVPPGSKIACLDVLFKSKHEPKFRCEDNCGSHISRPSIDLHLLHDIEIKLGSVRRKAGVEKRCEVGLRGSHRIFKRIVHFPLFPCKCAPQST